MGGTTENLSLNKTACLSRRAVDSRYLAPISKFNSVDGSLPIVTISW